MARAIEHHFLAYYVTYEDEIARTEWEYDFDYICFLVSEKLHPCAGQILRYITEDEYTYSDIARILQYSRMNIVFIMNRVKKYLEKNRKKLF